MPGGRKKAAARARREAQDEPAPAPKPAPSSPSVVHVGDARGDLADVLDPLLKATFGHASCDLEIQDCEVTTELDDGIICKCDKCERVEILYFMKRAQCCGKLVCLACCDELEELCTTCPVCAVPLVDIDWSGQILQHADRHAWAKHLRGEDLIQSSLGVSGAMAEAEFKEGIALVCLAASQRDPSAVVSKATLLRSSSIDRLSRVDFEELFGFRQDDKSYRAFLVKDLLEKSAKQGNPHGMRMLGELLIQVGLFAAARSMFRRVFDAYGSYCSIACRNTSISFSNAPETIAYEVQKSAYWLAKTQTWPEVFAPGDSLSQLEISFWYLQKATNVDDVSGLRDRFNRCMICSNPATVGCSACKCARYCSKECAKADWPRHKPVCVHIRKNKNTEFKQPKTSTQRLNIARSEDERPCAVIDVGQGNSIRLVFN